MGNRNQQNGVRSDLTECRVRMVITVGTRSITYVQPYGRNAAQC